MKSRSINRSGGNRKWRILFAAVFTFLLAIPEINAQNGEALFKTNCSSCHDAGSKRSTGPGLAGVTKRRSAEWILKWVTNPADVVNAGDPAAVALVKDFNNFMMPPQNVKPEEITAIMKFIEDKEVADAKKHTDDSLAKAKADKEMKNANPPKQPMFSRNVKILLLIIGVLFIALYFFLTHVNQSMVDAVGRGIPFFDNSEGGFMDKWISANKPFVFLFCAMILGGCALFIWMLIQQVM